VRSRFGRLGGIYLTLANEPQSITAWARGSVGERLLGEALEALHDEERLMILHDRRIPGTKANIDHVAITRSGEIWAIDAKNYKGRVRRVDKGGWFTVDERLYVGTQDRTKLLRAMGAQTGAIAAALGQATIEEFDLQLKAALCFVEAEWSLFAKPFSIGNVWVGWRNALCARLLRPGELSPEHLRLLARRAADALPAA
jgi:hypothetical protein